MPTDSPPKHIIRPATRADSPDLARLLTLLGHRSTEQGIVGLWPEWAGQGNVALVATDGSGKIQGLVTLHSMLVLHRPKPVGRITALIVDSATRGSGIGRALLKAAESLLTQRGCGLIEITSNIHLTEAHAFYEHLGYTRTSIRLAKELPS